MNIKKICVLIVSGFLIQLILSCSECTDIEEFKYKLDSFEAFNVDNSGSEPVLKESGSIPKSAFGLRIQFTLRELAIFKKRKFSLIAVAQAFSHCRPSFTRTALDTISAITITSLNTLDDMHQNGSDVTSMFKVLSSGKYIKISDYIFDPTIRDFDKIKSEQLQFYLLNYNVKSGEHRFKIDIRLSDKREMSFTTAPIYLE